MNCSNNKYPHTPCKPEDSPSSGAPDGQGRCTIITLHMNQSCCAKRKQVILCSISLCPVCSLHAYNVSCVAHAFDTPTQRDATMSVMQTQRDNMEWDPNRILWDNIPDANAIKCWVDTWQKSWKDSVVPESVCGYQSGFFKYLLSLLIKLCIGL